MHKIKNVIWKYDFSRMGRFLLSVLFNIILLNAQELPKDMKLHFAKQTVTKNPKYLQPVIDPVYKTKITRITDFKTFDNSYPRHRYSKNQPFNCNSTLIKLQTKWLIDAKTYKIIKKFPKSIHFNTSIWSHKNPNILYIFRDDGIILKYNVKNNHLQKICKIKGYDRVALGPNEGNIDTNDHYAAFACKRGEDLDIIIFDLYKRKIIKKRRFAKKWGSSYNPSWFDWISISQSGKYVIILWNKKIKDNFKSGDVKVYNTFDLSFRATLYNYGNHGDICYDSFNNEVYVQFAGKAKINAYRLKDAKSMAIHQNPEFETGASRHLSCRNYRQKGWCYISTQKNGLVLAVKLDGSGKVKYITAHNSTQQNYLKTASAVPNPDGSKILFSSDWQNRDKEVVFDYIAEKCEK